MKQTIIYRTVNSNSGVSLWGEVEDDVLISHYLTNRELLDMERVVRSWYTGEAVKSYARRQVAYQYFRI